MQMRGYCREQNKEEKDVLLMGIIPYLHAHQYSCNLTHQASNSISIPCYRLNSRCKHERKTASSDIGHTKIIKNVLIIAHQQNQNDFAHFKIMISQIQGRRLEKQCCVKEI